MGVELVPQDMATAVEDSLRDKTHESNAASSINQIYIPLNLYRWTNFCKEKKKEMKSL